MMRRLVPSLSQQVRKKIKDAIEHVIEWLDGLWLVDSEEYADKLEMREHLQSHH